MSRPSLRELVTSSTGSIEDAALLIASDAYPRLDTSRYVARLDDLADRVVARLGRGSTVLEQIDALRRVLVTEAGLRGNRDAYYDPRNSYLNEVLDRGLGIPISLSIVVLAVARRAGIVAEGIGFPGHFLVRVGGPGGRLVDPFHELAVLGPSELATLARRFLGPNARVSEDHLAPVDRRSVVIRMLTNLRAVHEQRKDDGLALLVCDRLVELEAGPQALRDRGLHALALGAGAAARADLEGYLAAVPNASDKPAILKALGRASVKRALN